MSGIYIPGMEMPTSCAECRFYGEYCYAKGDENKYSNLPCPLVPVPAHGRLINADALPEHKFVCIPKVTINGKDTGSAYRLGWNSAIEAIMENAETIIGGE